MNDKYDPEFDSPEARVNFHTRHISNRFVRRQHKDALIEEYSKETVVDIFPGSAPENSSRVFGKIRTTGEELKKYCAEGDDSDWKHVISGYWSEGSYHSGHIAYHVQKVSESTWVMRSEQRHDCLDDVTAEDVVEGCLDHNQICAMQGMTLEEAQDLTYHEIVAVYHDASNGLSHDDAGLLLYKAVCHAGGMQIDEPDESGSYAIL